MTCSNVTVANLDAIVSAWECRMHFLLLDGMRRSYQLQADPTHALTFMLQGTLAVGILFVTIISWIPGHAASYIGEGADIPGRQPKSPCPCCRPSLLELALKYNWKTGLA